MTVGINRLITTEPALALVAELTRQSEDGMSTVCLKLWQNAMSCIHTTAWIRTQAD